MVESDLRSGAVLDNVFHGSKRMNFYDEIELEDMDFDSEENKYTYPCPCGDKFEITLDELKDGDDVARCPSCSLIIKVIFDPEDLDDEDSDEEIVLGQPVTTIKVV
ncbi:Diphthamide biosynthesis protein 3 [Coemansia interrupta]|uniref:Diphthamide biosynthesis protein 3 n=1 Tax=Coemansia interrupta TaxID=1126814 RepID=A0A9W8LIP8_9FUNG|nr:Diphthamide biosynthesis protein 3 [Coemansia interrupta]